MSQDLLDEFRSLENLFILEGLPSCIGRGRIRPNASFVDLEEFLCYVL
jgi:hypothetical protein